MRGLLEGGLRRWRYQRHEGLPVDHVDSWITMQLAAWGESPEERRASRVELWQNLKYIGVGTAHPQHEGTIAAAVLFTPEAVDRIGRPEPEGISGHTGNWTSRPLGEVIDMFAAAEHVDGGGLREWHQTTPELHASAVHEEVLTIRGPREDGGGALPGNGAVLRLLLPYRDAKITQVTLDGHRLDESPVDGFQVTRGPGCVVHVAIPPGKVSDMHMATCLYEPGERRLEGFQAEDWHR